MSELSTKYDVAENLKLSHELQSVLNIPSHELQARGRARAESLGLPFAGTVYPPEAWALFKSGDVTLVDVRTIEERKYVGHVPDTPHIAWQFGSTMTKNPRFLKELERLAPKEAVVLLLCRSGKRSAAAAEAISKAGYVNAFNVLEGFEGELDNQQHRGENDGWRHWGLPWIQE